ncbi:hypothetical protein QA646_05665 [Rhizobium sp. CB3090]|uniref:hypothetical protein n=1 Tax=Rhizobium sp. CB3090 TaxID=3039156 RepID=UPI0024B25762|nr:hypothetical protein [Rhizobium sp. CB3090]WFU10345.1 hypothetical protein QA646_05665 [Rhizobium sp. CB3090]
MITILENSDRRMWSDWFRVEVDTHKSMKDERCQASHGIDFPEDRQAFGYRGRAFLFQRRKEPYAVAQRRLAVGVSKEVLGILKTMSGTDLRCRRKPMQHCAACGCFCNLRIALPFDGVQIDVTTVGIGSQKIWRRAFPADVQEDVVEPGWSAAPGNDGVIDI